MSRSHRASARAQLALAACCLLFCVAIAAQAQYNTYDSDSNSDSEGGPILTNGELGKLMRGSARGRPTGAQLRQLHAGQQQQQLAASRNLYNRQQAATALQYAPSQSTRRQFGGPAELSSGYFGAGAGEADEPSGRLRGEASSSGDGDDEASNFGPNFGANFDSDSNGDEQALRLNQAASGYPSGSEYGAAGEQHSPFGASNFNAGYGASEGAEFGPSADSFGAEPRRAKSASSLMGSRNLGGAGDEDAGAPQFGPNSAINANEADDEGRAGYSPEASSDASGADDDDE